MLRILVRTILRLGWRLRVEGIENLPAHGPYIITPNHPSEIDAVVLAAILPFRPTFLASRHLEEFPTLIRLIRYFSHPVFVRRRLGDVGAIKACLERLRRGEVLVVFPEGEVVQRADLGPMNLGAAFLAIHGAVPVVPVALIGLATMWPLGARWPRLSRLLIRVGDPIIPPDSNGTRAVELTETIARALRGLLGQEKVHGTPSG